MIDQQTTIDLAIKAGVIDSADINSIHISQAYIDDLSEFAYLVQQVERAETIKALELYHARLVEIGNEYGPDVVRAAINMLEDLRE
jgi:hypothetical protein